MSTPGLDQSPLFAVSPAAPEGAAGGGRRVSRPGGRRGRSLSLCVLGSGSGGNSTVLRVGGACILLDAGFGPRTTARKLAQASIALEQVRAVCVTHLDQDHFRGTWIRTLLELGIRLFVHRWHLDALRRLPDGDRLQQEGLLEVFDGQPFAPLTDVPGLSLAAVPLPHDQKGTVGFVVEAEGARLGYATDLGNVPRELIERFAGVDVVAIESNYDPQLELESSRPAFLKQRIMGGRGHLSNQQAFDAVRAIADRSPAGCPRQVVLLHRSGQCNHPMRIRRVWEQDALLADRVVLTEQRRRTAWIEVRPEGAATREQLRLWH
jgi:phosphoribosyl 1,2-cyclic phosphodiesterase